MAKKTVDEILKEVNYSEINHYKPSKFALEFVTFVKTISAENPLQDTPPIHFKMIDGLLSKNMYLVNLCARGLAKTSLFGEFLILYIADHKGLPTADGGFNPINAIMYIADSMENGAKSLKNNIEHRYNSSAYLRKKFSGRFTQESLVFKYPDVTDEQGNIKQVGYELMVKLFGAKSGVRGFKHGGKRPQLAILDDIMSDSDANSPTVLANLNDIIYKAIPPAMEPEVSKIIFNGTPFNKKDPIYRAVESDDLGWESNVYPICEKFPCSREEFKGAWEDRFSYDYVRRMYEFNQSMGQTSAFNQEYMLQIASEEDRIIKDDDIQWYSRDELMEYPYRYNYYITSDFATTDSKTSDYTVILVWALDWKNNFYLVDGIVNKQLLDKTSDDVFRFVEQYSPLGVGLEISGPQNGYVSLFEQQMQWRETFFNMATHIRTNRIGVPATTNKLKRFELMLPDFKNKRIHLPTELKDKFLVKEIVEELSNITKDRIKSAHDDCIDAISQLRQIYLTFPDKEQGMLLKDPILFYPDENEDVDQVFPGDSTRDYFLGY